MQYNDLYLKVIENKLGERTFLSSELDQEIRRLRKEYAGKTLAWHQSNISFESDRMRCAYLYSYAVCHSAIVEYYVTKLGKVSLFALFSTTLRICCLGGGPGGDALAVLKGLTENYHLNQFTVLQVLIIDSCSFWEDTFNDIFREAKNDEYFKEAVPENIVCSFIEADLTQPWSSEVVEGVRTADIVTMVKFVSAVNGSRSGSERVAWMLKTVVDNLQTGSYLMYIDNATGGYFEQISEAVGEREQMKPVCDPMVRHRLSLLNVSEDQLPSTTVSAVVWRVPVYQEWTLYTAQQVVKLF